MKNLITKYRSSFSSLVLNKTNPYNYSVLRPITIKRGLIGNLPKKIKSKMDETVGEKQLKELRKRNHQLYYKISTNDLNNLSEYYPEQVSQIRTRYNNIKALDLLSDEYQDVQRHYEELVQIINDVNYLLDSISQELQKLIEKNDAREKKISIDHLELDDEYLDVIAHKIKEQYSALQLFNMSTDIDNSDFEYGRQLKRTTYIEELEKSLVEYDAMVIKRDRHLQTIKINEEISPLLDELSIKVKELQKLILPTDKRYEDFKTFLKYYKDLIKYDSNSLVSASKELARLKKDKIFNALYDKFKNSIKMEKIQEEKSYIETSKVYFMDCMKAIKDNYILLLTKKTRDQFFLKYDELSSNKTFTVDEIKSYEKFLEPIIRNIWDLNINRRPDFVSGDKFKFICYNGPLESERYVGTLITDRTLRKAEVIGDYSEGYILSYPGEILVIAYNSEIDLDSKRNVSRFRTPAQIEDKFVKNKKTNRLLLKSKNVKPKYYYCIKDDDTDIKAVEKRAKKAKLPLLIINRKDYRKI